MKYTLLNTPRKNIPGLSFRTVRQGPETEMILNFISTVRIRVPRGCEITFFQEPRLDSGFPDLVVVVWHRATAEKWIPERSLLNSADLRLLHHLTNNGTLENLALKTLFGPKVTHSLEKLEAAGTIRQSRSKYTAYPLTQLYATRRIVAIEAKISEWRGALNQAFMNRWFASESFVLLPKLIKSTDLMPQAQRMGVRVWSMNENALELDICGRTRPISYASWLFNEWACRSADDSNATIGDIRC